MDLGLPGDVDQVRVHYVKVTNGLDVPFTDRFDGVPVTIPAGKSENIPLDMAAHFFGYHYGIEPSAMFRYVAKRQGWNRPEHVIQNPDTRKTLAEDYFDKLKIEPVLYKLVKAEPDDPKTPVPAEPAMDREPPAPPSKGPRRIEASV